MSVYNSRGKDEPYPELVLVLGKTGVGKSTFIKSATGLDVEIGDGLLSCMYEYLPPPPFPPRSLNCSRHLLILQTNTDLQRHPRSADLPRPKLPRLPH